MNYETEEGKYDSHSLNKKKKDLLKEKVIEGFVFIYSVPVLLLGLYWNIKFIINEGFLEWVLNGDVIMISLKATVWPFSLLIWGL